MTGIVQMAEDVTRIAGACFPLLTAQGVTQLQPLFVTPNAEMELFSHLKIVMINQITG